jgi:hypothetical protein
MQQGPCSRCSHGGRAGQAPTLAPPFSSSATSSLASSRRTTVPVAAQGRLSTPAQLCRSASSSPAQAHPHSPGSHIRSGACHQQSFLQRFAPCATRAVGVGRLFATSAQKLACISYQSLLAAGACRPAARSALPACLLQGQALQRHAGALQWHAGALSSPALLRACGQAQLVLVLGEDEARERAPVQAAVPAQRDALPRLRFFKRAVVLRLQPHQRPKYVLVRVRVLVPARPASARHASLYVPLTVSRRTPAPCTPHSHSCPEAQQRRQQLPWPQQSSCQPA